MLLHENWYSPIGKKFRDENKDLAAEPLPERWVDLILYLDEVERKRGGRKEAQAPPQDRKH